MKKLLIILALMLSLILCLSACGGEGDGGTDDGTGDKPGNGEGSTPDGGDGTPDENAFDDYVYYEGFKATIIVTDNNAAKKATAAYNSIKSLTGIAPYLFTDDESEDEGHEIIFGESNRRASERAYRSLKMIDRSSDFHVRYSVYALGNSLAIAYDDEFNAYALNQVVKKLVDEVFAGNKNLKLTSGVVIEGTVSVLEEAKARDAEYEKNAWAAVEEALGSENRALIDALHRYYSIYNGEVATWLANLYDPEIGGFYYSNSARDNHGYAPDIESTGQALGFISNMAHLSGANYSSVLSKEILDDIGAYIKSLQDPDGYFYNYQWTKISHGTSRLARDLSSAVGILKSVGLKPTYDTPLGDKGDGKVYELPDAAVSVWPTALASSTATMVSKVVLTAHAEYLENADTLLDYLNNLEKSAGGNFYGIGSNITSQMNQIQARDRVLRQAYNNLPPEDRTEPYRSLVDLVIEWFNSKQNPTTGLWSDVSNYNAINGILKIMGIYNSAGVAVKDAEKMTLAAFDAVTSDEPVGGIVCVYNTWSAILKVINNLKNYGETVEIDGVVMTGPERATRLLGIIRKSAPEAVDATAEKLKLYLKDDGSFSYRTNQSSPTSQGMPVAVPGTNEGDVNATVLATNGNTKSMFTSLGISGLTVAIFGEEELVKFLYIMDNLQPVIKNEIDTTPADEPIDFEDEDEGEAPVSTGTLIREGSRAYIEKDTKKGKILTVHSAAGVGDYVYSENRGAVKNGNCYIFSGDIKVSKGGGYDLQLTVGAHYLLSLNIKNGVITIREETSTTGSESIKRDLATRNVGEWFNLRIEYYRAGGTDGPRTKVYIDGELIAISKAFYGLKAGDATVSASSADFSRTTLYVMKSREVIISYDNIVSYVSDKGYSGATDSDKSIVFDDDKAK